MFTNPTASISSSLDCTLPYHQTLKSSSILLPLDICLVESDIKHGGFLQRICTSASIYPELFKSKARCLNVDPWKVLPLYQYLFFSYGNVTHKVKLFEHLF